MSEEIKIGNLGYTASNNPFRATRDGQEYEELMPAPDWREQIVKRNGNVKDTVHEMQKLISKYAWQTKKLSEKLKGNSVYETSQNIWEFLYNHFKYKEDDKGQEQLRTPALSWNLRTKRGIDCDDFAIFAGTLFYNLNIPFYLRIAHYPDFDHFSHVYNIVPQGNKKYIAVDAVLDSFDAEKEPIVETKDFLVMKDEKLNGIDVAILSGIENETAKELFGIITGADFPDDEINGVSTEEQLDAVYKHLVETRDLIRNNPALIKNNEDPHSFLQMLDYAIQYWHTDKRDEALAILEQKEQEINELEGLSGMSDDYEETTVFYGMEGLGGINVLGKTQKVRAFFSKVKDVVKKAGDTVKTDIKKVGAVVVKAFRALIRVSPVTITARAGLLLALKLNIGKIAERLKWGYLPEDQAKKRGFDMGEWGKNKNELKIAENLFVDVMQGSADHFKSSILTGRAGGLAGFSEELGVVAAASAGTIITTAMPFILKILDMLKKVDYKKMNKNVAPETLENGKAAAEESNPVPPDVKEALPEINNRIARKVNPATTDAANDTADTNNLPVETKKETPTATEVSVFTHVTNWVKEHPGTSALIAGGLILAFSTKVRHAVGLGGVLKVGKKKKGKTKSHPPKAISGTHKRKGKGGATKKIKL